MKNTKMEIKIWKGYLAEVRTLPMLLAIGTAIMGAAFAAGSAVKWGLLVGVVINAYLFLYAAHLNDTFWDLRKGEYEPDRVFHDAQIDEDSFLARIGFGTEIKNAPLLDPRYYKNAILVCSAVGSVLAIGIASIVGWGYLPLAMGGLLLASTYSAGLDKLPVIGDLMWEVGMVLCLFCGFYSMSGSLEPPVIQMAMGLFIALVGIKMLDGWYDLAVDMKNDKMTFPVFVTKHFNFSQERIRDIAYSLIYVTLGLLLIQMPLPFYPGILVGATLIGGSHYRYRGIDMERRLGVAWVAVGVLFFIYWSIFMFLMG